MRSPVQVPSESPNGPDGVAAQAHKNIQPATESLMRVTIATRRPNEVKAGEALLRTNYPAYEAAVGKKHIETLAARARMAELCDLTNKPDEARRWRKADGK